MKAATTVALRAGIALIAAGASAAWMLGPASANARTVEAFGFNAAWASPNNTPPGPGAEWLPAIRTRGMDSNRIAGMTWRHFTVGGEACTASPPAGHTCNSRWTRLDDALSAHQDEGMAPMVVLADSLANSGPDTKVTGDEVAVYAEVMRQLTIRYTSCGTFCLIDAIQVWNEPNSGGFGGYSVEEYRTLFLAALDAIRSVQPDMRVISGSPAPTGGGWRDYQREIAKFPREFILGAHIYPLDAADEGEILATARNQYNVSRNAVDEDGDTRPVRVTEVGVCTGEPTVACPNRQAYDIDEAQQAEELTRVCKMLANRGAEGIMVHTLLASHPGGNQAGSGIRNDLAVEPYFRPAWEAIEGCHLGWSPPASTSAPVISGTAREGETLTVSDGTWDGDGSIAYTYQWLRCDAADALCPEIHGATDASYELAAADAGRWLRARVTAVNAWGTASATSEPVLVAGLAPPVIEPAPTDVPSSEPPPGDADPGGPPPAGPPVLALPPSNLFSFDGLDRNPRRGIARLRIGVPGPGSVALSRTNEVRRASRRAGSAGRVMLAVRPRGRAQRSVSDRRCGRSARAKLRVRVRAVVTYRPTGGAPRTQQRRVRLVRRCRSDG